MSKTMAIALRELQAYFLSPMAYILMCVFLLINGLVFMMVIQVLLQPDAAQGAVMSFFLGGNQFVWIFISLLVPLLTMRTFAEERQKGTIELLMTAPVSAQQVVWGKYISTCFMYIILWLPTILYALILRLYTPIDWGPVFTGYLGLILPGMMFCAAGILCSMFTRNQIIAAIATFMIVISLFSIGLFEYVFNDGPAKDLFVYLNMWSHLDSFSRGIIHTRTLVYYGSLTAFFLFLSLRKAEARIWQ